MANSRMRFGEKKPDRYPVLAGNGRRRPDTTCPECGQPVFRGYTAEHVRCDMRIQARLDAEMLARKRGDIPPSRGSDPTRLG